MTHISDNHEPSGAEQLSRGFAGWPKAMAAMAVATRVFRGETR